MSIHIKSIKYNFIMNLILTTSNFLFPLITFPYVSRVLLPEGVGRVAFAQSIIEYFLAIATFGVVGYGVRACAQARDDKERLSKTVHEIFIINLIMAGISYILFFILLYSVARIHQDFSLFLVVSLSILFTVLGIEWLYKGIENYQYITIRSIIFKFISLALIFIFVKDKDDYIYFAGISVFALVGSSILNLINARKIIFFKRYENYELRKHFLPMLFLCLTSLSYALYITANETILGFLSNHQNVGIFSVALRVKGILLTFIVALGVVLMPRLSYYIENDLMEEFIDVLNKSMSFIIFISFPTAVFFYVYSQEVIFVLVGNDFINSILILKVIIWGIVVTGITNVLGVQVLLPLKKDKQFFLSIFCAAILNITLNFILVPKLGALGSAISLLSAEILVLLIQMYMLRSMLVNIFRKIEYAKIVLACMVTLCITVPISNYIIYFENILYKILVASVLFYMTYLFLLYIMREKNISYVLDVLSTKLKR